MSIRRKKGSYSEIPRYTHSVLLFFLFLRRLLSVLFSARLMSACLFRFDDDDDDVDVGGRWALFLLGCDLPHQLFFSHIFRWILMTRQS